MSSLISKHFPSIRITENFTTKIVQILTWYQEPRFDFGLGVDFYEVVRENPTRKLSISFRFKLKWLGLEAVICELPCLMERSSSSGK